MDNGCWFQIGQLVANCSIGIFALWLGAFRSIIRKKSPEIVVSKFVDKNVTETCLGLAVLV